TAHVRAHVEQMAGGTHLSGGRRARLGGVARRHDELVSVPPRMHGREQQSPYRLQLTGQPELPVELARTATLGLPQLSGSEKNAECDGQIEPTAFLRQLRGSEAH